MKKLLLFAAGFMFVFLAAAFISWDINPGNWSHEGRYYTFVFGALAGVLFFGIFD